MARIELYKNKINNMSNIIDNVRAEVSGYALALTGLYSKFLAINSSVVDNVISSLSTATKIQEEQISGLNATQRQIDAFVLTVQVTDNRVASCIKELTKMYEAVYNYSHDVSTDIATDSLAEWLYKNWGDRFTYGYVLYNGDDLENMSQEEFDKYVEQLLALDYNSLSVEDETRVQAVLDYLSGVNINGSMSDSDKKKVSQYNSIYEKRYIDDAKAINEFFQKSAYKENGELKSGITEEDIANIKFLSYNSTGDIHSIFFSNIAKCKVIKWDNKDGSYYHIDDDGKEKGIYFMNKTGSYGTFFHEIGHHIDDLLYGEEGEFYSSSSFTFGTLHQAMLSDVESTINSVIDNYSNTEMKLSDSDKDKIKRVLMGRQSEKILFENNSILLTSAYGACKTISLDHAYRKIYEDVTGSYKGFFTRDASWGDEQGVLNGSQLVSEVYCGITNNALMPIDSKKVSISDDGDSSNDSYGNKLPGHPFGYVEYDYYYKNGDINSISSGLGESEFIAEYFRIHMIGETSSETYAKQYLEQTFDFAERILRMKVLQ